MKKVSKGQKIILVIMFIVMVEMVLYPLGIVNATTFSVGRQKLEIPPPEGFVQVTQEMDAVYRWRQQIDNVYQANDTLASYIVESDVPIAKLGKMPLLKHIWSIAVNRKIKNIVVSPQDFDEFKKTVKHQNKEYFKSMEAEIPDLMEKLSKGISNEFDMSYILKTLQTVLLDPHYETGNILAYSMYIKNSINEKDFTVCVTVTYVNVAGKILFLYCYGEQKDLEWTRNASKVWTEKIIASNVQPLSSSSNTVGINWDDYLTTAKEVAPKAFLTVIIFALFSLIYHKFKKKD